VSLRYGDNEEEGCHVGDVSELEAHSDFLNGDLERIRWTEANDYDCAEGSQNNGMRKGLSLGT
jgi:hypothetical protein